MLAIGMPFRSSGSDRVRRRKFLQTMSLPFPCHLYARTVVYLRILVPQLKSLYTKDLRHNNFASCGHTFVSSDAGGY
jgi:hypothetical protein